MNSQLEVYTFKRTFHTPWTEPLELHLFAFMKIFAKKGIRHEVSQKSLYRDASLFFHRLIMRKDQMKMDQSIQTCPDQEFEQNSKLIILKDFSGFYSIFLALQVAT